jgi:hypothetical protein
LLSEAAFGGKIIVDCDMVIAPFYIFSDFIKFGMVHFAGKVA